MTNVTDRIKQEAINAANAAQQTQATQSFEPKNNGGDEYQPNLIDNIGKLIATPLTKPVVDSVLKHIVLGVESEINRLIGTQPKQESTNATNPVLDVFVTTQTHSYESTNVRVFSSNAASASLPSASTSREGITNGNGKGFAPKN